MPDPLARNARRTARTAAVLLSLALAGRRCARQATTRSTSFRTRVTDSNRRASHTAFETQSRTSGSSIRDPATARVRLPRS